MSEYLTLGAVLILGVVGHNMTVVYAAVIVLAIKIFAQVSGSPIFLDYLGSHGLNFGIIILTAAIQIFSIWATARVFQSKKLFQPLKKLSAKKLKPKLELVAQETPRS